MFESVIEFWFNELEPKMWWQKSDDLDATINSRFGELLVQAAKGELFGWRETAKGSLAEVIVLDQFSRNIHRDTRKAFECDPLALALSQFAISTGADKELSVDERKFLYMPFMHSESKVIHAEALRLFSELGSPQNLEFELKHKVIIDRFGRYPHRNKILGRESTAEEIDFLKQDGSSF